MGLGGGTESEYVDALRQLLPRGPVWLAPDGSIFRGVLASAAAMLASVHVRAVQLLDERDPRFAIEALSDWERVLDIPGPCGSLGATIQQRRDAILQKLTETGGQTPAYFVELAARLGHPGAVVEEYDYLRAGDPAGSPVIGEAWKHAFTIRTVEDLAITEFRAGQSTAGEPLRSWGNDALECAIEHAKPAHTTAVFAYGSV